MPSTDTEELIQKLRDRDPESLTSLYMTYGRKIYNLAYRMTGSREDAEDITQETFLQVYRNARSFHGQSQLYTWIYAIAKHLCYRSFQRSKESSFVSFEKLIQDSRDTEPVSGINGLEKENLIRQIKKGCLTGLLRCLSFNQRIAFILHIILRLPLRDVARILNKSEPAAKVLAHRARKNLKNFLCKNCSVYDPANPCHCEDLLGFSLKQGWIEQSFPKGKPSLDTQRIEEEIKRIRDVVELYTDLSMPDASEDLYHRVQELIQAQKEIIFTSTRV